MYYHRITVFESVRAVFGDTAIAMNVIGGNHLCSNVFCSGKLGAYQNQVNFKLAESRIIMQGVGNGVTLVV